MPRHSFLLLRRCALEGARRHIVRNLPCLGRQGLDSNCDPVTPALSGEAWAADPGLGRPARGFDTKDS